MPATATRRRRDLGEKLLLAPRGGVEYAERSLRALPALPALPEAVETRPALAPPPRRAWSAERRRRFQRRFLPLLGTVLAAPPTIAFVAVDFPRAAAATAQASSGPQRRQTRADGLIAAPAARGSRADPVHLATGWPLPRWHETQSLGLPWNGSLLNGVQLPREGRDFVTWDPVFNRVPNRDRRRYGSRKLVRTLLRVLAEYHAAHPGAARVVIGDLSRIGGGSLDQHHSHENGLDVDVYYPRKDGREFEPPRVDLIDMRLAQDLVDRFVAAGAQYVFVGPDTPLHGTGGIVEKLSAHDNHMHVRIYG